MESDRIKGPIWLRLSRWRAMKCPVCEGETLSAPGRCRNCHADLGNYHGEKATGRHKPVVRILFIAAFVIVGVWLVLGSVIEPVRRPKWPTTTGEIVSLEMWQRYTGGETGEFADYLTRRHARRARRYASPMIRRSLILPWLICTGKGVRGATATVGL